MFLWYPREANEHLTIIHMFSEGTNLEHMQTYADLTLSCLDLIIGPLDWIVFDHLSILICPLTWIWMPSWTWHMPVHSCVMARIYCFWWKQKMKTSKSQKTCCLATWPFSVLQSLCRCPRCGAPVGPWHGPGGSTITVQVFSSHHIAGDKAQCGDVWVFVLTLEGLPKLTGSKSRHPGSCWWWLDDITVWNFQNVEPPWDKLAERQPSHAADLSADHMSVSSFHTSVSTDAFFLLRHLPRLSIRETYL